MKFRLITAVSIQSRGFNPRKLSNKIFYFRRMKNTKDQSKIPSDVSASMALENDYTRIVYPNDISSFPSQILYRTPHFCVINKPPDIRMDGDFQITIQKLVSKWTNRPENSLKWVHQLDFATSGVLCVGLHKAAAAAAASSFEHRDVKKQYLAVLQGHINTSRWLVSRVDTDNIVNSQKESLLATNKSLQRKLAALNHQRNMEMQLLHNVQSANVDSGNSSANIKVTYWQDKVKEENLQECLSAWKIIDEGLALSEDDPSRPSWTTNPDIMKDIAFIKWQPLELLRTSAKLRKVMRKVLKRCGIEIKLTESIASESLVTGRTQEKTNTDEVFVEYKPPEQVPLTEDEIKEVIKMHLSKAESIIKIDEKRLIIDIPVAEVVGEFRMEPGHDRNPGKKSVTELEILEYCEYKGMPVTKVLFKPISGRRHQLRIHSLCIGHPIVGDFTYNSFHRELIDIQSPSIAERMMLHAYTLYIPFPDSGKCKSSLRLMLHEQEKTDDVNSLSSCSTDEVEELIKTGPKLTNKERSALKIEQPLIDVKSPDPFPIIDGEVKPLQLGGEYK